MNGEAVAGSARARQRTPITGGGHEAFLLVVPRARRAGAEYRLGVPGEPSLRGTFALVVVLGGCVGGTANDPGGGAPSSGMTTTDTGSSTSTGATSTGEPTTGSGTTEVASSSTGEDPWIPGPPSTCGPPCPTTWTYDGWLSPEPGDDLTPFSCLTRVTGSLRLYGAFPPGALDVFANLQEVDGLSIAADPSRTDLAPFTCLHETRSLFLEDLPALIDASALANLRSAASVQIRNTGLSALPEFAPDFAGVEYLHVDSCPALVKVDAAAAWPVIGAIDLTLSRNHALTSIAALAPMFAASPDDARVLLTDLPALESLAGLEELRSGVRLQFGDLPLVTSLAPLAKLERVEYLLLVRLPGLTSLAGLDALHSADQLRLGHCTRWNDDDGGLAGLTSLAGLGGLVEARDLRIRGLLGLTDLTGAEMLTTVEHLEVVGNPLLTPDNFFAFAAQLMPPVEKQFTVTCDD